MKRGTEAANAPDDFNGPGAAAEWEMASPESQGMGPARLETMWKDLAARRTAAFLVVRGDRIVFERYATGCSRTTPHYTASLAKALVGALSLMVTMSDGLTHPDEPVGRYVPRWAEDAVKSQVTLRHLATHTSGLEDAEADGLPHDQLTGWKGDFWKRPPPPRDPFTLSRDHAPLLEAPGTRPRYSNPGMAMLACCVTVALQGSEHADLRSLLRRRIMEPLGVPEAEWSCGYGTATLPDGLNLVANWGGGSYSPNATARVGRLMLHRGEWNGRRLLGPAVVDAATRHAGMPNHAGLGWWVNQNADGTRPWPSAPADAFWGAGAGQQFLLVIPSMELIVVRNGGILDEGLPFNEGLETHVVGPLMQALGPSHGAPYPPSPVIRGITWAPASTIIRQACDSDCWPLTWGDDGHLYTAYGDGHGFDPKAPEKLSLGFARVAGSPPDFSGINIRSATGERKGDGAAGEKASGLLMVDGVLYVWVRNAGNSRLGWSAGHGRSWTWTEWKFTTSFGCPTFLNFGGNYHGARDGFVYVYSPDADSAYLPADRMILARVPKERVRERAAYEFFEGLDATGGAVWSSEIARRGAVFTHPGRCYRCGVSFNAALRRYLWCQTLPGGDARFAGGFGIFDAPEPWGPWSTVFCTERWDVGPGETSSFPTKWMSPDGKTLFLVFSSEDCFSVRKATLTVDEHD
jgi:CubicO group peptidase (beta-lactamase class C family)